MQTRRSAKETVEAQNRSHPLLTNQIVRESLNAFLTKSGKSTEDEEQNNVKFPQLMALLKACAVFEESTSTREREGLISQLILLAHHPRLCVFILTTILFPSTDIPFRW